MSSDQKESKTEGLESEVDALCKEFTKWLSKIQSGKAKDAEEATVLPIGLKEGYGEYPNIYRHMGINYLQLGEYVEAIEQFEKAVGIYNGGKRFSEIPLKPESLEGKELAWKDEDSLDEELLAWVYHDLGLSHFKLGDYQKAEDYYNLAVNTATAALHIHRGSEERFKRAMGWFRNDMGWLYSDQKKYDQAINQYNDILRQDSENVYAMINKGVALYNIGKYEQARDEMSKAKKISEARIRFQRNEKTSNLLAKAAILNNIARIEIDTDSYDTADVYIREAKEIYDELENKIKEMVPLKKEDVDSSIAALYNNSGILFYKLGMDEKAQKDYETSLEHARIPRTYYNLGILYNEDGKADRAERLIREAFRLDPDMEEAKRYLLVAGDRKALSWWSWWFNGTSKKTRPLSRIARIKGIMCENVICRKGVGFILLVLTTTMLLDLVYLAVFSKGMSVIETVDNSSANITLTETITQLSIESRLLVTAILVFFLILPQVRSFGVGNVKFDMEPMSKGSTERTYMPK